MDHKGSAMRPHSLDAESAYRRMSFIRQFEEKCLELSRNGEIAGSIHLCLGQEAIPVGAMSVLQPQDRVLATYRGHGWALASGSDPTSTMAEIAQREGGLNGGRAGSPLLSDPQNGFLGENSIVGAGSPIAAGVGLAFASTEPERVVLTSFGDGAMSQGATMEGMLFAAARNLPVIFACENNGWSEMTPTRHMARSTDMVDRARGLGIESHVVDGGDPFAVASAVAAAAERCRAGNGPVFLEFKTVRLSGHYNRDIEHYRPKDDQQAAIESDPLTRLREVGARTGALSAEGADGIDRDLKSEIDAIAATVVAMAAPDSSSVEEHLLADELAIESGAWGPSTSTELTYWKAVNSALEAELDARPELLVYGEDVGFAGGIFGVTRNLQKKFGESRVFDTPIAESAILGSAVGAALCGMRPVVEIMWADFVFVALDQIVNQAANVRYVNSGRLSAPVTIRMQQGVTDGSCAQHAQSVEYLFAHIPGIKVGLASTPQDAYRMTRAAINDPDPTVLIESRSLYQDSGVVDMGGNSEIAAGARRHRSGGDVAIISWGAMVNKAIEAADRLKAEGIDATVLDLRWLRPLDDESIDAAVQEAGGRVVVAHEDAVTGGFGAEVAARITERSFAVLEGPVTRVGSREVRIPSAPSLQSGVVPSVTSIMEAARVAANRA